MSERGEMFSIGEMAKAIGITRKIILNYEAKGLIRPDIKEEPAGNRYYTIDTFTQIRTIRTFQRMGLSLDEIRNYFNGTTDLLPLVKRLEALRDEINLNIEKLYERIDMKCSKISRITVGPQTVYGKICKASSIKEKSDTLRETALEAMREYGTDTTRRMYFTEYALKSPDEILYAVSVYPESKGKWILNFPKFEAISLYHYGAYENITVSREKLTAYAKENNLKISGTCRHVYVEGPPQHKDPSRYITQILLPIESGNDEKQ